MTPQVLEFLRANKEKLTGRIIEIGSRYENGTVRDVVDIAVGVDMRKGVGVDLVAPVESLLSHFKPGEFDACVSTETLEHCSDWKEFVRVTWSLVKDDGWLVMTMASKFKSRHAYPDDYVRFEEEQIRMIYPNAEFIGPLGRVSIGWAVKKNGELGDLDSITPLPVLDKVKK